MVEVRRPRTLVIIPAYNESATIVRAGPRPPAGGGVADLGCSRDTRHSRPRPQLTEGMRVR